MAENKRGAEIKRFGTGRSKSGAGWSPCNKEAQPAVVWYTLVLSALLCGVVHFGFICSLVWCGCVVHFGFV